MTKQNVIDEAIADLTIELQNDTDFNANILALKVKFAYNEIVTKRNYIATSLSADEIAEDIYNNYYHTLINVSRFDYNTIGVEGETQHAENDITRQYGDRNKYFCDVFPFVKVL